MGPAEVSADGGDGAAVQMEEDAFLGFVDYAMSELSPEEEERDERRGPAWSWVVSRILKTCLAYSSGVTPAIILSELFQSWSEHNRYLTSKRRLEHMIPMEKRRRRTRLSNTVTIDSIYEKNFLSTSSILEAVVLKAYVLPGTDIYMLNLGDFWSSCTIDLYLHRRYYNLVHPDHGILREGREIFLTGCCLRTGMTGSGQPRLLPTEYLLILLDEDQDEDAMLLGAQFCSDSFSSISLDTSKEDPSYSFYTRQEKTNLFHFFKFFLVKSIGQLEVHGKFGYVQRRQITLDCDGISLNFVGSMLALDRPFIASTSDSKLEANEDICLEFGSATQLYLVPFIQPEEQVLIACTQTRSQRSRMATVTDQSQDFNNSQVTLPLDSQGSVDFRNYPFRLFVINLCGKMTGINLYGLVRDIHRDVESAEVIYSMTLEDVTGAVVVKLHFSTCWSLGRLNVGHTIYITGLTCCMTSGNLPKVSWHEKDLGASLIDLSGLPALLNSSCLHKLSLLSSLSNRMNATHLIIVGCIQDLHAVCGHFVNERPDGSLECSLCRCSCDDELVRGFHLQVHLQDESATVSAWCAGQTATELLQISPDDFFELPEVEQAMYLYTLENEGFLVALANTKVCCEGSSMTVDDESETIWEIVRAQKCD
ncbi:unnamed protein product [Spirodela intermedia]|uniref:Uncharacterized protein n=1 Tax=Spirodela intermedia TaxID=51605 RepID=A0A7I8IWI9_SPIIN|nr:unnamed protein product [Spirodela intermedia]CAA6662180.1 unnamed protein product [Spirodela intermedia]